jgi:hypothetical protein
VGSDDDKKSSTANPANSVLGSTRFASIFTAVTKGAQSPIVKKALAMLAETAAPTPRLSILSQTQAAQLSMQLSDVLAALATACDTQRRRLANGVMPWDKVNSARVTTAIQALQGIADRLSRAVSGLVAASQLSAAVSQPLPRANPPLSVDTGPSLAIVANRRVHPEQVQRVADNLRRIHEYAIEVSTQIRRSIDGPSGANPFALDGALAETDMLAKILHDALPSLRDMFAGVTDPRSSAS